MLTDTVIRSTKPNGKSFQLRDGRGLFLEFSPRGGKWWRFRYRFGGKENRLSLGIYPDISLKMARKRREELREMVAQGIDPGAERKARKASIMSKNASTFEVVAREWLVKQVPGWSKANASKVVRMFERDIFPWIGKTPISDLTAPELLEVLRRIEERGAAETARRALGDCNRVFRYAAITGRIQNDPCANLKGALKTQKKRGHFAAETKPEKLARILRMIDNYCGNLPVRCALKLAPLVFVRPGELRQAKWSDIDFDNARWCYLVTKTQTEHIVPLARQALEILQEVRRLTGRGTYVFPSARGNNRPMSDNALLVALRSMEIGKKETTVHGFRATARTILDEILGVRLEYIEHQLAHKVSDPLGQAYNRTVHMEERTKMMQIWADYLDGLRAGEDVKTLEQKYRWGGNV